MARLLPPDVVLSHLLRGAIWGLDVTNMGQFLKRVWGEECPSPLSLFIAWLTQS